MAVRHACSSVSFGEERLAVSIKAGYDLTLPHHEDGVAALANKAADALMAETPRL